MHHDRVKERVQRLLERLDAYQQEHSWAGFPVAVVRKFGDDQAGNLAALIAYYALFSVFPLLLVLTTILGFVLEGNPGLSQQLFSTALNQFPIIGNRVGEQVHALQGNTVGLVVGLVGALWGGLGVANMAQTAVNSIWEVPMVQRPNILKQTLRSVLLLLIVGTGIVLTTLVNGVSSATEQYGLHLGLALRVLAALGALVINIALFTISFTVLPARDIRPRDILPGAVVAAVIWQVMQYLGGLYVTHVVKGASQTYGTFAVVIGLLSWIYLLAQLTLLAVEVDVVRIQRFWPRALLNPPQTDADRRAYEAYAETQRYQRREQVHTHFADESEDQSGGSGAPQQQL